MSDSNNSQDQLVFDNAPNRLTLLRIAVVPAGVYFLSWRSLNGDIFACLLFWLRAVTDLLDAVAVIAYKAGMT